MRGSILKFATAMALASGCLIAVGCSGNPTDPDGGAGSGGTGAGGAGGAGGTNPAGSGGSNPTGGTGGSMGTVGCVTPPPIVPCPTPPTTYAKVAPIFQARCVNTCHNGTTPDPNNNNEPIWALTDYKHVKDWGDAIRDQIGNCLMPPADAGVPVTIEERQAILEWIKCGYPL